MDGIIGHKNVLNYLDKSVKNGKVSHSYLFIGPLSIGKFTVARKFAGKLIGGELSSSFAHPNVFVVSQEEKIKIEQIRELRRFLSLSPYSSKNKVAIVNNIEQFGKEAANALLKTLEEPPPNSVIILIASKPGKVLSTITSRCQIIRFYPVRESELANDIKRQNPDISDDLIKISAGRPGVALGLINNKDFYLNKQNSLKNFKTLFSKNIAEKFDLAKNIVEQEDIQAVMEDWALYCREELAYKIGLSETSFLGLNLSVKRLNKIIKKILEVKKLISDTNVNNLLAMENLMLETIKTK